MNNQETIEQVQQSIERLKNGVGTHKKVPIESDSSVREFNFRDVEIDQGILVSGIPVSNTSARKILSKLRVRNNFIELNEYVKPGIWDTVSSAIKEFQHGGVFYGIVSTDESSGNQTLVDISYPSVKGKGGKSKETDLRDIIAKPIPSREIIDSLCLELGMTPKEYEFVSSSYDHDTNNLIIDLLRRNEIINPFDSQSNDGWKHGMRLVIGKLGLKFAPFIQRLSCTNGMEEQVHGVFRSSVAHKKYDIDSITGKIHEMLNTDTAIGEQIGNAISHLQNTNISLSEFFEFRKIIERHNKDGFYSNILARYFDITPLSKAYNVDFSTCKDTWLKTADTGINAYDFLNQLTWLGTHRRETILSETLGRELQVKSSSLFFRRQLDMELIAPKLNIIYPRNNSMN